MALAQGRNTVEIVDGKTLVLPVKSNTRIYEGSIVAIDATGCAIPGKKADGLIAAGRADEYVDNTGVGGSNGAKTVKVRRGVFKWSNSAADPVTDTDILKTCYILDDETVTIKADAASPAGTVIGIDGDEVLVAIE